MATTQPTNAKIEELRARLQLEPTSRLFFPLAEELRKAGQVEEAERVLREGIDRNPAYLSAWVSLGRVLAQRENHAEAVDAFNRALQLDPENIVAARMSAESHLKLGNKVEAIKKYKLVHAFLPSDQEIQAHIESLERDLNPDRYFRPIAISDSSSEFNVYSDEQVEVERDEDLPKTKVLPVVTPPPQNAPTTAAPEALAAETSAFLADAFASPERRMSKPEITSIPAATTTEPLMEVAAEPMIEQAAEPFVEPVPEFVMEAVPVPVELAEPFAELPAPSAAEPPAAESQAAALATEESSPAAPASGKKDSVVKLETWLGKMRRDHGQRI